MISKGFGQASYELGSNMRDDHRQVRSTARLTARLHNTDQGSQMMMGRTSRKWDQSSNACIMKASSIFGIQRFVSTLSHETYQAGNCCARPQHTPTLMV